MPYRSTPPDFRALIIARYGTLPDEEANMPYHDPNIYNDMYMRQYLNYVAEWYTYPNESMGHYCRRFQDTMLPYIPRELDDPEWRALHIIRDGLPPEVKQFVPTPIMGITLEDMMDAIIEVEIIACMVQVVAQEDDYILVPYDDAGIPEPLFEGGPFLPEDPILAIPLQEIPPEEAKADADGNEEDPADLLAVPEDQPEDPPVIIIASDDDAEDDVEEIIDIEEPEDDPEEIARFNQIPQVKVVPPQENPVPPVVPQVPEVHHEIPQNAEVPLAPVGIQANPPLIMEDLLYERFRRMKTPEFEGPMDPMEADNWLIDIQDARHWWMTVQMCRNVATMSWQNFVTEFRTMYYNREILAAQQDEFNNFKQGSMTVLEAVKKLEQLARLCPKLEPNETEKVRRIMKMFRTDITKQVSAGSSPPTLVSDCISRVIRAEYWINKDKEAMAQIFKAKKEENAVVKQSQPRQNQELYLRG
ncbi:hypothetical protein TIFTF001_029512 [Ficus carica]|uniref:Retrotransposon gag domain-containing protein n=1 Tax=Ficus carica TaxID=3494 RepID=A0AA88IY50_FICCA|nr:hypothetical protein TIFTF001_029512 [Ficus carica]